jgi:hypothetical protein
MSEEKIYADFPSHLSEKIMRGVAFIYNFHMKNYTDLNKLNEGVQTRLKFLEEEQGYTRKELRYVLLLLALPEVDEALRKSDILEKNFDSKYNVVH